MRQRPLHQGRGPFHIGQIAPGSGYELSDGHPIEWQPGGGRNSRANLVGGLALATDPAVESAGFDTGYAVEPGTLRAPDLAIGNVPDVAGWVDGVPPLAIEYADTGQNEADLGCKIGELLDAGTQEVWVVRLVGPRRVEVHRPGVPVRTALPGEELTAPGVLRNPVLVEALYDPGAAEAVALRNLLQRRGYEGLEAVLAQGKAEGREQGKTEGRAQGKAEGLEQGRAEGAREAMGRALVAVLESRGLALAPQSRERIDACTDPQQLEAWLRRAATVTASDALFAD